MHRVTVLVDDKMITEVDKLIPGNYINRTELLLKALKFFLENKHGIKFSVYPEFQQPNNDGKVV